LHCVHLGDNSSVLLNYQLCVGGTVRTIGGVEMNPVSVLKKREAGPKVDREARTQDDAQSECEMICLLSFLEADNKRLWQAVLELSIETATLRRVLKTEESRRRVADVKPTVRRPPRSRIAVSALPAARAPEAERHVLPFDR
jgi:hypothetical protein